MNTKKITNYAFSAALSASLFLGVLALPANAQTVGVTASTSVGAKATDRLPKIISRSDTAIAARIADLNKLSARIGEMKNVSAADKASFSSELQTNISGLTSLQAKINADTDATTASTDEKTITQSYRIYALVVPQGYIEASSDRVVTIVGMMNTLSAKLQARITAGQSAGTNVASLQSALSDLTAKTSDATVQSSAAQNGVGSLAPDQGNTTVAASNKSALVSARADIKTATSDLQAARQDAKTIVDGFKGLKINLSASTTASQ
jgi:hypothetical protein